MSLREKRPVFFFWSWKGYGRREFGGVGEYLLPTVGGWHGRRGGRRDLGVKRREEGGGGGRERPRRAEKRGWGLRI